MRQVLSRLLALSLLAFGALSPAAIGAGPALAQDATVFAAASLKTALDAVAAQYKAETGKAVTLSYAASSALAKQVEAGAPADLFISADLDWMDYLEKKDLVAPGTRRTLLANTLVLVAPGDSKASVTIAKGMDLAKVLGTGGRLAVADVVAVPAGKYAKAALESLGAWDGVKDRLAQAENVRAALLLVSRGEAPAGIVYATDARAEPKVRVLGAFPADSHPPILYPAARLKGAKSADAQAFLDYLASPKAAGIFQAQGFTVVGR